jgi:hypothetical protein
MSAMAFLLMITRIMGLADPQTWRHATPHRVGCRGRISGGKPGLFLKSDCSMKTSDLMNGKTAAKYCGVRKSYLQAL